MMLGLGLVVATQATSVDGFGGAPPRRSWLPASSTSGRCCRTGSWDLRGPTLIFVLLVKVGYFSSLLLGGVVGVEDGWVAVGVEKVVRGQIMAAIYHGSYGANF